MTAHLPKIIIKFGSIAAHAEELIEGLEELVEGRGDRNALMTDVRAIRGLLVDLEVIETMDALRADTLLPLPRN